MPFPWLLVLLAVVAVWGTVAYFVQPFGDFTKRLLLSLSAFSFKRSYGAGGVCLLVALVAAVSQRWELGIVNPSLLKTQDPLQRGTEIALYIAFGLPLLATVGSELTFLLIRRWTKTKPNHLQFMTIQTTGETQERKQSEESQRITTQLLIPVHPPTGGVKAILRCFLSQTFASHLAGYAPYSGLAGAYESDDKEDASRVVILAKEADAQDFEYFGDRGFQIQRVTNSCHILVRKPLPQEEQAAFGKKLSRKIRAVREAAAARRLREVRWPGDPPEGV